MKKFIAILIFALLLAIAAAKHKSADFEAVYEAEKEAHEALIEKRNEENENAKKLSELKKKSYANQKADYRHWADLPVPDDFKLLMRAAGK